MENLGKHTPFMAKYATSEWSEAQILATEAAAKEVGYEVSYEGEEAEKTMVLSGEGIDNLRFNSLLAKKLEEIEK